MDLLEPDAPALPPLCVAPDAGADGLWTGDARAEAHAVLRAARADVAQVMESLRRSAALSWESPAADAFRTAVAELVVTLDADLRVLDEAAAVVVLA
ncbi:hypothetical protein GCM10009809_15600 [Isoptericola hypogeus]|uniref:Uncharacterized protein n=1 Tax=Isoptericola hypogeus TaxID=300179 RepID=A0ABN2J9R3_9MICO